MTPDSYMASGGPGDPGSWNRYAYTRGDPVNRTDPAGTCDQSGDTSTSVTVCGGFNPLDWNFFLAQAGGNGTIAWSTSQVSWGGTVIASTLNSLTSAVWAVQEASKSLDAARTRALQALQNPSCLSLFQTDQSKAAGIDPVQVFNALYGNTGTLFPPATIVNGKPVSSAFVPQFLIGVNVDAAESLSLTVGFNQGTPFVGIGISVYLNATTWVQNAQAGTTNFNAETLLHELGHVLNDLFSGASKIAGDAGDADKSFDNTLKVLNQCNLTIP